MGSAIGNLLEVGQKQATTKMTLASTSLTLLAAVAVTSGAPWNNWNSYQPGQTCKTVTDVKYRTEYVNECSQGEYNYELCRPTKNTVCEPADRIRCKYEYKDYNKEVCHDVAQKVCDKVCQCQFHIRFSYLNPIFCQFPLLTSYAKTYYHFKFRSGRKTTVAGLTN